MSTQNSQKCPICKGKGEIRGDCGGDFDILSFLMPKRAMGGIMQEIERIIKIAEINTRYPALNIGLALEYICQLSSQTPEESLL